jgi:hypothetical protein
LQGDVGFIITLMNSTQEAVLQAFARLSKDFH